MSTTFPLISVIGADVNLKAVLVFVLFVTELADYCRGGDVLVNDVLHEISPSVSLLAADRATKHLVTGINNQAGHAGVIPEI